MLQLRTRSIAAGAIVVLSVIGAGAALGAVANKGKGSSAKATAAAKSTARTDGHGIRGGDDLDAAVSYLGLTPAQVQADLAAGKTLAQIAAATTGKSTDGLIGALVAHEKAEIAAKVTAGTITQAQADAVIPTLTAHFTAFVNGTGFGRGGHGPGDGGHTARVATAA